MSRYSIGASDSVKKLKRAMCEVLGIKSQRLGRYWILTKDGEPWNHVFAYRKENVFDDAPDYSTDVHECVEVLETIMKAHPSVSVQLKAHTADWLCAIEDDESKTYISEYAETLAIACCKAILIWCARFPMTVSAREYEYDDEDEKQW